MNETAVNKASRQVYSFEVWTYTRANLKKNLNQILIEAKLLFLKSTAFFSLNIIVHILTSSIVLPFTLLKDAEVLL